MIYRVIGLMSGSSLDGLDIAFVEFDESGGKWGYEIKAAESIAYSGDWVSKLKNAPQLSAYDYLLLHSEYGRFTGDLVNSFIDRNNLDHQVQLIVSHGHTVFHKPGLGMTAQLGDGATIAAVTGINVVSDLRALDVAFGGQGAPIVPIGEKLLFIDYSIFLNLGGIANISFANTDNYRAFDVCANNRVLNMLAGKTGKEYDEGGNIAAEGKVDTALLTRLNSLPYFKLPYPKSLDNSFSDDYIFPIIESVDLSVPNAMRTFVEHVVMQIGYACQQFVKGNESLKMMVTGGGTHNTFLINRLKEHLQALQINLEIPPNELINNKEALIMALIGLLRWREEYNVISSVTGAKRDSINGAVWIGQEA